MGTRRDSRASTRARLTKKSMLVVDCLKDNRFARDPEVVANQVRSVLCVPFQDLVTRSKGLIYVDNISKPDAFTYKDLAKVDDFAKVLATQLDLSEYEPKKPEPKEELQAEIESPSPWLAVGGVVATAVLLIPALWSTLAPAPAPVETPTIVTKETSGADQIALSFVRALASRSVDGAYIYLSPEMKKEIPSEDFEKRVQDFLKSDSAFRLMRAKIDSADVKAASAKVFLDTGAPEDDWDIALTRVEGVWYVHSFSGFGSKSRTADSSPEQ